MNFSVYTFGGSDESNRIYDANLRRLRLSSRKGKMVLSRVSPRAGTKPTPRFGHTLNFYFPAQLLLLFGGQAQNSRFLNDFHVFDLRQREWSEVKMEDPLLSLKRAHHSCDVLDGRIFVFGGINGEGFLGNEILSFALEDQGHRMRPQFLL